MYIDIDIIIDIIMIWIWVPNLYIYLYLSTYGSHSFWDGQAIGRRIYL